MNSFLTRYGPRVLGALAALVPVLAAVRPDVPWEALLGASAALLGAGEVVQRVEDRKTLDALYSDPPEAEA